MPRKSDAFSPYASQEELAQGQRRAVLWLVIGAAALVLAFVARQYVEDVRLVRTYLVAGALHVLAAVGPLVRISRTGEFQRAD